MRRMDSSAKIILKLCRKASKVSFTLPIDTSGSALAVARLSERKFPDLVSTPRGL